MDHFNYSDNELYAEEVPISQIAAKIGTPFYCYSTATLAHHYEIFARAFSGIDAAFCYAVKANSNLAIIRTLSNLGAGADVVSSGELERAIKAGIPPSKIVFSGVGKTRSEIAFALTTNIGQFNIESESELEVLAEIVASRGITANIAIRVNPDVDAATHEKISTGRRQDKFGIAWPRARQVYALAAQKSGVKVVGVATHIGSQITDLKPFEAAFTKIVEMVNMLRLDGHCINRLDLGGGLGIRYQDETPPTPTDYGIMVKRITSGLNCELVFEPGRVLVGNAGILVCRVIYIKEAEGNTFAIVDGAMNDLLRPSLYGAKHAIIPVCEHACDSQISSVDIVGPVCESGDTFAYSQPMQALSSGDLIAIRSAGAYGASMSSNYNSRPLTPEVLVKKDMFEVIRRKQSLEDIIAIERMPSWLGDSKKIYSKPSS